MPIIQYNQEIFQILELLLKHLESINSTITVESIQLKKPKFCLEDKLPGKSKLNLHDQATRFILEVNLLLRKSTRVKVRITKNVKRCRY